MKSMFINRPQNSNTNNLYATKNDKNKEKEEKKNKKEKDKKSKEKDEKKETGILSLEQFNKELD